MRYTDYLIEADMSPKDLKTIEKLKTRYSNLGDDVIEDIFTKLIGTGKGVLMWALQNADEFQQLTDEELSTFTTWAIEENKLSQGNIPLKNKSPKEVVELISTVKNADLDRWALNHWNDYKEHKNEMGTISDWLNVAHPTDNIKNMSFRELQQKEQDWHNELARAGASDEGANVSEAGGEVLIKYPNGYYWLDLHTTDSEEERKLMGHCGHTDSGDTLISLRKKVPNGVKAMVTLATSNNHTIYHQGKGKANTLPKKEYQKYIVDFFIKYHTKKYEPEVLSTVDFNITDFEDYNDYKRLKDNNPDLVQSMIDEAPAGAKLGFYYRLKDQHPDAVANFTELLTDTLNEKLPTDSSMTISDDLSLYVPTHEVNKFWYKDYDAGKINELLDATNKVTEGKLHYFNSKLFEGVITQKDDYYVIDKDTLAKYVSYYHSALNNTNINMDFILRRIYYAYIS